MDNNISDLLIIILVTFHGVIHEVITAFIENTGLWVDYLYVGTEHALMSNAL